MLLSLTLALLLSVALGVSVANATHSDGEGSDKDFARGTGSTQLGFQPLGSPDLTIVDVKIHENATSGPMGEDPQGRFYFRAETSDGEVVDVMGEVTCLNVVGNRAGIGGMITKANPVLGGGNGVLITVEDNGEPGTGLDEVGVIPTQTPPTVLCPPNVTAPVTQGNYVVHDATP